LAQGYRGHLVGEPTFSEGGGCEGNRNLIFLGKKESKPERCPLHGFGGGMVEGGGVCGGWAHGDTSKNREPIKRST